MKKIILAILMAQLVLLPNLFGQSPRTYYHINNGWTDINLNGKIKGKFSWQIENQHRREDMQGDYNDATTTGNPYHNLNQNVFRPYIHYQANPNVRFSLMPLGWIGSNKFKDGQPIAFFSEIRVTPQVILSQQIGKLKIDHKFRYEFRWIGNNQDINNKSFLYGGDFENATFKRRFRYQLKGTIPLNKPKMEDKTWYAQAYNEFFINMGEKVPNTNLLDQNRVLVGLGYRLNGFYSFEAGYMEQVIFRFNDANKVNADVNNIFQLNFVVSNIDKLLGKKKE